MGFQSVLRNIPYLRQQMATLVGNASPNVLFICIITICGYLLSFADAVVPVLSVTPGYLMPPSFYIWTLFTFWCMELHFWEVIVDFITVGLCGKLMEPLWGRLEMLYFFAITNIGVALLSSFYFLTLYMFTGNTEYLFDLHIHGLAGYVAAVLVAGRQIMPDLLIVKTPIGKLTNRNVPLIVLLISMMLWAFGLLDSIFPVMFTSGMIVSWTYLRFYQRHGNRGRGDGSESFTFASFFPNVLQPFISIAVTPLHVFCLRIGAIRPHIPISNAPLTSVNVTIPGISDPQNLERRRQIALKALSERLSKTTDSSRQNVLPKSIPAPATAAQAKQFPRTNNSDNSRPHHHHQHHDHRHHGHSHGHGHSHQHQHQPQHVPSQHVPQMIFELPAIALPPPPTAVTSSSAPDTNRHGSSSDTPTTRTTTKDQSTIDLLQ